MRQLGQHQFEHDPGRHQPRQQELRAGLAPRPPDRRRRHARQRRARPERHPEQQQIDARAARRGIPARPACSACRRRSNRRKMHRRRARRSRRTTAAPAPASTSGPRPGAAATAMRADRSRIASVTIVSTTNIRISGPLSRMPPASAVQKIAGQRPWRMRGILAALPGQIDPRQRAHRRDHRRAAAWRRSWRAAPRRRAAPNCT